MSVVQVRGCGLTYTTELNGDCDIVRALGLELEVLNSEVLVVLGV